LKILTIAVPSKDAAFGGGSLRAFQSIEFMARKRNIDVYLLVPDSAIAYSTPKSKVDSLYETLNYLTSLGVKLLGFIPLYRYVTRFIPLLKGGVKGRRIVYSYYVMNFADRVANELLIKVPKDIDVVYSLHETSECISIAYALSRKLKAQSAALLQLPIKYNEARMKKLAHALIKGYTLLYGIRGYLYSRINLFLRDKIGEKLLPLIKEFDKVILVSKAISVDMGLQTKNMHFLDPGVSLDQNELNAIAQLRKSGLCNTRSNYVIFSAKPTVEKGIVDLVFVWCKVLRQMPSSNLSLIITGNVSQDLKYRLMRLMSKEIGKDVNITFTGFLPRYELLKYKYRAQAMIYPSHVDAYPFTVLENMLLGLPTISYDIPAITINYDKYINKLIFIAKENDIEELASRVIELLSSLEKKPYSTETHNVDRIPTIQDVLTQELEILTG